jgi:glucokinase
VRRRGLGEWVAGAARGYARVVAITLGTGVGSAFLDAGTVVSSGPTVPPNGDVYRLFINGCPLEQAVSNRAIVASYAAQPCSPAVTQPVNVPAGERTDYEIRDELTELERRQRELAQELAELGAAD